uniref:Mitochondrial ribosomal protein L48 n=1 Tax=Mustela putorius furo TaxID=9669 RepID=M3YE83_MUSPF
MMNGALGKMLCLRNDIIFKQAFSLLRVRTSGENPISSAGGILLSTSRHYKTRPTHGIGRYKHLVKPQEPKKKRAKVEVRPINLGTDYEYGVLNIHLTAYDMAVVESYAQYVHNLCNHLSIKVEERYEGSLYMGYSWFTLCPPKPWRCCGYRTKAAKCSRTQFSPPMSEWFR